MLRSSSTARLKGAHVPVHSLEEGNEKVDHQYILYKEVDCL